MVGAPLGLDPGRWRGGPGVHTPGYERSPLRGCML